MDQILRLSLPGSRSYQATRGAPRPSDESRKESRLYQVGTSVRSPSSVDHEVPGSRGSGSRGSGSRGSAGSGLLSVRRPYTPGHHSTVGPSGTGTCTTCHAERRSRTCDPSIGRLGRSPGIGGPAHLEAQRGPDARDFRALSITISTWAGYPFPDRLEPLLVPSEGCMV